MHTSQYSVRSRNGVPNQELVTCQGVDQGQAGAGDWVPPLLYHEHHLHRPGQALPACRGGEDHGTEDGNTSHVLYSCWSWSRKQLQASMTKRQDGRGMQGKGPAAHE